MKKNNKTESNIKANQFQRNFFRAIKYTSDFLNENPDFQYYLIWMMFSEAKFNKTTSPLLDQHLRENYSEIERNDMLDYYLTKMNKKRLFEAVEEFITGSGGGRFKKVLNQINASIEQEKFVC